MRAQVRAVALGERQAIKTLACGQPVAAIRRMRAASPVCEVCGTPLPSAAKFCPECAHPVAARAPAGGAGNAGGWTPAAPGAFDGERKLVTVLFADLTGSTELIADRDPEEARKLLDLVLEHMCEAVEEYGGTVSQVMGDGILALFGAPIAWEDHAVRACHAALSMQDLVRHYGDDIQRAYEDLQWVTSDTRDFLDAFARETPPSPLVLLTYRSDYDAGWLAQRGHLEIRLEGLAPDATRRIIAELLGQDESLAALTDRLAREDKHVPQTLGAVGEAATVGFLERVGNMPTEDLRKSLRRLERAGLLVERTDRDELAYEFKNALAHAVAYGTLLRERRRELHRGILAALRDSADFDVLARHAEQGEAWDQALTHLREAGRINAQFGGREAVSYFERALQALDRLPAAARSLETAFDLHCELRNALVPLGQHPRLLQALKAAERIAEALGDERRLAQIYSFLSNFYGSVGHSDLALEAGERSLVLGERVGATDLLRVGNMSAGEIYRTLGDYAKAKTFLTRAVALIDPRDEQAYAGQVGLPAVRARDHLVWTLAELGEFPAAGAAAAEAMRIADASNHPYSICHACLGLGGMRVRQGEFEAASAVLGRGFAKSAQVPLLRPPLAADLGPARAHCGRLAEGLSHLDAAVEGATTMGRFSRLPLLLVKCGEIHLLAGDADGAMRLADAALRLAAEQKERGNQVYARNLLGEIQRRAAQTSAEAERHLLDALALAGELGMRPLAAHARAGLSRCYDARVADRAKAAQHRAAAVTLYRDMAMRFWLERLAAETAAQREATARVMMADENDDPALTVKSAFHALCWRVCEDIEPAVESGVSRS